jgi:hypothetical protein
MSKPFNQHSGGPEIRLDALERRTRVRDGIYLVSNVPDAATAEGIPIYVQDGAAGLPVLAFSDGSDWLRCDTRTPISET